MARKAIIRFPRKATFVTQVSYQRFEGKVAVVTGAAGGIGRATAEALAAEGARVAIVDIDRTAAERVAREIDGGTSRAIGISADVSVSSDVRKAIEDVNDAYGRIDILVNNAGGAETKSILKWPDDDFDHVIALNFAAVWHLSRAAAKPMLSQGKGAIVNISSVAGMRNDFGSGRNHVGYSASKAGVIQLSRSTAGAYAKRGIRVNTVVPGLMHTPLVETRLAKTVGNNDLDALIEARNKAVPIGRMGDAWDVAHAVLFLLSDEARYITGTEIIVDGGLTAAMP